MATVDKNFRIKNGLAVEGTIATVNGENILREGSGDSYIINLIGGTATSDNTPNAVVKRDGSGNFSAGTIALAGITVQNAGSIYEDSSFIIESNSGYAIDIHGNQDVNITSQNGDINLNPDGNARVNGQVIATQGYADDVAGNAQSAANTYTDGIATQLASSIQQAYSDAVDTANSHSDGLVASEATNRNNAIDSAISAEVYDRNNAIDSAIISEVTNRNSAIATAKQEANDYTDTAVSTLVNGAPALLDTLGELATALQDNPDIISNLQDVASGKQDSFTAGDGLTFNGTSLDIELDPTSGLSLAGGLLAVDTNSIATRSYADGVASDALSSAQTYAEGQASSAYDAAVADSATYTDNQISNGNASANPIYQGVRLGYYTELISGWNSVSNGAAFSPLSWNSAYGTAKLTVHVRDGVHSQASEVLIARDSANNIAITEYAIVTTNGILADISASYANNQISLTVSPTNGHTTVEAVATGSAIVWAD